jgi:hypothetical protein
VCLWSLLTCPGPDSRKSYSARLIFPIMRANLRKNVTLEFDYSIFDLNSKLEGKLKDFWALA